MKHRILSATAVAVLVVLTGCSSNPLSQNSSIAPGSNATAPISEQTATSDFARQGITIKYSLWSGAVESIEVIGYAPVWGNSQNALRESFRVAELEAKKALNDFINKETITSTVSVKMISQNLEQARDKKTNNFSSNRAGNSDELVAIDEEVDREKNVQNTRDENVAVRNVALKVSSQVNTTITNTNQGILGGLYMVDGQAVNSGKNVRVIMRWDRKHDDIRLQVRGLMMR